MNNKLTLLSLCFLSLSTFSIQPKEAIQISITIKGTADEAARKELFDQAVKSMHDICEATSCEVKLNLNQGVSQTDAEFDTASEVVLAKALHANVESFVNACNKHANAEGHNVTFCIDDTNMDIAIVITCKEAEPKPSYWQSVKSTLKSAGQTVSTKAKNAGGYFKTGAQKVADAARTVKDKTKQGIHAVAEKVSEITE